MNEEMNIMRPYIHLNSWRGRLEGLPAYSEKLDLESPKPLAPISDPVTH